MLTTSAHHGAGSAPSAGYSNLNSIDRHASHLGESPTHIARHELKLRRPCRFVDLDEQYPIGESDRCDVTSNRLTHRFLPTSKYAARSCSVGASE